MRLTFRILFSLQDRVHGSDSEEDDDDVVDLDTKPAALPGKGKSGKSKFAQDGSNGAAFVAGAAGRAPPASTQQVMKASKGKIEGTAPSLAPKSKSQPPRFTLKPPPPGAVGPTTKEKDDGAVAPTSSTLATLTLLRDFVGPSYSEKQLTKCLTECGYDVDRAAEKLLTLGVSSSSTSSQETGMQAAKRASTQAQRGAKSDTALSDWTNLFGIASSKTKRKCEDGKPSASSTAGDGTGKSKRIKVGASSEAASGRPADAKPAASTGKRKSDKTSGSIGAPHALQQSQGAVEDTKPKIVDLLMVRLVRSVRFFVRTSICRSSLTRTTAFFCQQDAFEALAISSTTTGTTTTSIESDPEASEVMAALKHHRTLESILSDDVGPRHDKGLASDDELQQACSEIAASEKELFELAKLFLDFGLEDVDEAEGLPEIEGDDPPESKVEAPPKSNSSRGRDPKVTASGFVKRDWCDFKTADGNPNWDKMQAFHDGIKQPCREKDAIKCILNLRDTPDIKQGGEVHHIIPRSLGGSNDKANLRRVKTVHHIYQHGYTHLVSFNWQNAAAFAFMTDTRGKHGMKHILDDEVMMHDLAAARDAAREARRQFFAQPGVREAWSAHIRNAMARPEVREAIRKASRKTWASRELRMATSTRMRKIQAEKRAAKNRPVGASKIPRCSVKGCGKFGTHSGMCFVCFKRANDGEMPESQKCAVTICKNGRRAGGLCCYHTAIQAEMNTVTTQLASVATSSREELLELLSPTMAPLVLRSERSMRGGKWVCIVQDCTTLAHTSSDLKMCGKHNTMQRKIDAALAQRPPGVLEMTLPELQDTASNAFIAKLQDLEEQFASPSPNSKGQHVSRLDPKDERFLEAFANPNLAGEATGTKNLSRSLKNANGGVIRLYSRKLKAEVCFRYSTDEEAALIAPSVDAVNAAKAALESFAKRQTGKHHNTEDIPVTQLDPKNQGAFLRTFPSISVAGEKNGITGSLLQSKVKDAHKNGEPYAQLFAYCPDVDDATEVVDLVESWFRYATESEIATIPPELRKRRGRRKSALAAASKDRAVSEESLAESPPSLAPTANPPPATVKQAKKDPSAKTGTQAEWLSASDESVSELEGESEDETVLD
jgi:5-methylcytosine-specific restriction endonuclease McrA